MHASLLNPLTALLALSSLAVAAPLSALEEGFLFNFKSIDSSQSHNRRELQAPEKVIEYRVPGTYTKIIARTRGKPIPKVSFRKTLENCENAVKQIIRKDGDGPISREHKDPFVYPPPERPEDMILTVRSSGPSARLRWSEVKNLIVALFAAMYQRGLYYEIVFAIFEEVIPGIPVQEGQGNYYEKNHPPPASLTLPSADFVN